MTDQKRGERQPVTKAQQQAFMRELVRLGHWIPERPPSDLPTTADAPSLAYEKWNAALDGEWDKLRVGIDWGHSKSHTVYEMWQRPTEQHPQGMHAVKVDGGEWEQIGTFEHSVDVADPIQTLPKEQDAMRVYPPPSDLSDAVSRGVDAILDRNRFKEHVIMSARLLTSIREEEPCLHYEPAYSEWQGLFEEAVCGVERAVAKLREFEDKNL